MALFQCVIAALVAAGVAVQPEAPVRRHREAAQTTSSQDYDEALDEQVGDDDVQSSALVASQPLPDAQDCPLGRKGRQCRRSQCPLIAQRRSGKYAAGNCGDDTCPVGYETITDNVTCEDAANELGLKWFPDGKERGRKNQANVCNFCGGCGRRDGFRSVRIDDNHFGVANFICIKKAAAAPAYHSLENSNGQCDKDHESNHIGHIKTIQCDDNGGRTIPQCAEECKNTPTCKGFGYGNAGGEHCSGDKGKCHMFSVKYCDTNPTWKWHALGQAAAPTTWVFDPYDTTRHQSSCDTVCQQRTGGTCNQAAFDALTDDASVIAAYTSAGFTCNSNTLSHNCEPDNCQRWGAPYLHNSHMAMGGAKRGICFGGTPSNGLPNKVAKCDQRPVDGWHRRLCPCSAASR